MTIKTFAYWTKQEDKLLASIYSQSYGRRNRFNLLSRHSENGIYLRALTLGLTEIERLTDWTAISRRFESRVKLNLETGCIEWQGSTEDGYGKVSIRENHKRTTYRAHQLAFKLKHRKLPNKPFELDHTCRNHLCVNLAHIEVVRHKINVYRGISIPAQNKRKTHCKNGHLLKKVKI